MSLFLISLLISTSFTTWCVVQRQYRDPQCQEPRSVNWKKVWTTDQCLGTASPSQNFMNSYNKADCNQADGTVTIYDYCSDDQCSTAPFGTSYCQPTVREIGECEESTIVPPGSWDTFGFTNVYFDKWNCEICEELHCNLELTNRASPCTLYEGVEGNDPLSDHQDNVNNSEEDEQKKNQEIMTIIIICSVVFVAIFMVVIVYFGMQISNDKADAVVDAPPMQLVSLTRNNSKKAEKEKGSCIIIGNWKYDNTNNFDELVEPEENVKIVENIFEDCTTFSRCNVDIDNIKSFVIESIQSVPSGPILFYYTGHVTESESDGEKTDRISLIGIGGKELNLRELINEFHGRDKLIVIDSCCTLKMREMFSDTLSVDNYDTVNEGNSFYALSFRLGEGEGEESAKKPSIFTETMGQSILNLNSKYGGNVTSLVHDCANEFGEIIQRGNYVYFLTEDAVSEVLDD